MLFVSTNKSVCAVDVSECSELVGNTFHLVTLYIYVMTVWRGQTPRLRTSGPHIKLLELSAHGAAPTVNCCWSTHDWWDYWFDKFRTKSRSTDSLKLIATKTKPKTVQLSSDDSGSVWIHLQCSEKQWTQTLPLSIGIRTNSRQLCRKTCRLSLTWHTYCVPLLSQEWWWLKWFSLSLHAQLSLLIWKNHNW